MCSLHESTSARTELTGRFFTPMPSRSGLQRSMLSQCRLHRAHVVPGRQCPTVAVQCARRPCVYRQLQGAGRNESRAGGGGVQLRHVPSVACLLGQVHKLPCQQVLCHTLPLAQESLDIHDAFAVGPRHEAAHMHTRSIGNVLGRIFIVSLSRGREREKVSTAQGCSWLEGYLACMMVPIVPVSVNTNMFMLEYWQNRASPVPFATCHCH